jgi:hypothetical protein
MVFSRITGVMWLLNNLLRCVCVLTLMCNASSNVTASTRNLLPVAARGSAVASSIPERKSGQVPLALKMSVAEQQYCEDRSWLKLRLRYVNNGERPIILFSYGHMAHHAFLSKLDSKGVKRKKPIAVHYTSRIFRLIPLLVDPEPGEEFVVIEPGGEFNTEATLSLPISTSEANAEDRVSPGRYSLQVVFQTWYESSEQAEELRKLWSSHGLFWSDDVRSGGTPLLIEAKKSLSANCP